VGQDFILPADFPSAKGRQSRGCGVGMRAVLVLLFLVGAMVRIANLDIDMRSPDERIYTAQSQAALVNGIQGTRQAVEAFYKNPQLWLYPPPTRIVYTWLVAASMKLTGARNETAGSWVSCLASIAILLLAIATGLRFFGPWPTVAGTLFLAVFPPELVIARRCWSDAPVELAGLAMMYCACVIWSGTRRSYPYVLLPLVGSAAVLVKETTVLLYAACLGVALWRAANNRMALLLTGVALAGAALTTALLDLATGSAAGAVRIIIGQAQNNATNAYALQYASGPGYLLLLAFIRLSPLTTVLAIWGLAVTVAQRRSTAPLAWLAIANMLPYILIPHWLNLRYASASFAPLCLFAGVGLVELLALVKVKWATVAAAAAVLVFAVADYQRFHTAWLRPEAQDLTVRMVFDVMRE
jgi:hypothetical protein